MTMLTECFVVEIKRFEICDGPARHVSQVTQQIICLRYF